MVRLLATMLLCLLTSCFGALAKPQPFIEITLETQEAFLGDTVVIEVRWSGLLDPLDFSVLERDAELVRQTSGTRIAVVEGQVIEIASRRIELQPLNIGILTLGPLEGDGITSNSVSIDVTEPRSVAWTPGADDVRLSQTISTPNPWLQQQIVLNIEFRTRYPLADEAAILPKFDDFWVVPVLVERRTLDEEGGWALTAWRYLLYPQRSGKLVIKGATIAGTLAKSRAERGTFELIAAPLELEVKPSAFPASSWWIAATSLTVKDEWSSDPTKLSAGDELDRIVTVNATGVLPEQLPDVVMDETQGLSITPLGVEREGKIVGDVAQATAHFRFRVRAISPIPVFLDTIRLRWWNTVADRAAEAIIPARRIDIGIPNRDALLEGALRGETRIDRLLVWASGYATSAYAALAVLALAALLLVGTGRDPLASARRWFSTWRSRRTLMSLARQGDAAGLYRSMRELSLASPATRLALKPPIASLGAALFGGASVPDLKTIARDAADRLQIQTSRVPGSSLPQL